MAERFTGFLELVGRDEDGAPHEELLTTIGPWPLDLIMERVRVRLEAAPAGTTIRIDLIAWGPDD